MTAEKLAESFRLELAGMADRNRARDMKAYMQGQFDYYGVSSPQRKEVQKRLFPPRGSVTPELYRSFFILAWSGEGREMKYVALDFARRYLDRKNHSLAVFFEPFILDQPWWDTVDTLVPNLLGPLLVSSGSLRNKAREWMDSGNLWLQRSALIVQLKSGPATDFALLCEMVLQSAGSREFFVRKAAGWALRQYSRFSPTEVRHFVEQSPQLSGLTRREALRLLL